MAPLHHGAFHQRGTPTATRFFGERCPVVLQERAALCRSLGTSIAFTVAGEGGGSWTLDFSTPTVTTGARPDASAHLELHNADFVRLLEGKLDVARAMAQGDVRFSGHLDALRALAAVFGEGVAA